MGRLGSRERPTILKFKTMSQFTEKDAIEMGESLPLLRKWETVMNILWSFFLAYSIREKNVSVVNDANLIRFRLKDGHNFQIGVNFYNQKYLSLFVKIEGNDEFEATINNIDAFGKEGIIKTVSHILTYAENVR